VAASVNKMSTSSILGDRCIFVTAYVNVWVSCKIIFIVVLEVTAIILALEHQGLSIAAQPPLGEPSQGFHGLQGAPV